MLLPLLLPPLLLIVVSMIMIWRIRVSHCFLASTSQRRRPPRSLLLVIAHPDDETMFFSPLLLSSAFSSIKILCLSHGDTERAAELRRCCESVFFPREEKGVAKARVHFSPRPFIDGMKENWDICEIHTLVGDFIRSEYEPALHPHEDVMVVTFDANGISNHRNHVAVHQGVRLLKMTKTLTPHVYFYSLRSETNLLMKYSSALGALTRVYLSLLSRSEPPALLFLNHTPVPVHRGMAMHASQNVWFRKFFVFFSTTTYVNVLTRL